MNIKGLIAILLIVLHVVSGCATARTAQKVCPEVVSHYNYSCQGEGCQDAKVAANIRAAALEAANQASSSLCYQQVEEKTPDWVPWVIAASGLATAGLGIWVGCSIGDCGGTPPPVRVLVPAPVPTAPQ